MRVSDRNVVSQPAGDTGLAEHDRHLGLTSEILDDDRLACRVVTSAACLAGTGSVWMGQAYLKAAWLMLDGSRGLQ